MVKELQMKNVLKKSRERLKSHGVIIHSGNLDDYDKFITLKENNNLQELLKGLTSVPIGIHDLLL